MAVANELMPQISRFFGIVITMFYNDHPPPHFHARYGESQTLIGIEDLAVLHGTLPPRALGLVMEWAALHQKGTHGQLGARALSGSAQ